MNLKITNKKSYNFIIGPIKSYSVNRESKMIMKIRLNLKTFIDNFSQNKKSRISHLNNLIWLKIYLFKSIKRPDIYRSLML